MRTIAPSAIGPAPGPSAKADVGTQDAPDGDQPPPAGGGDAADAESGRDADPRREVFRWFEEAFEGVRGELQALISSMTHQQAMLAELLDSRQAELRLALVAESLPDIVGEAVASAMDEHTEAMAQSFDRSHERFGDDVDQIRAETAATVAELADSFEKLAAAIAVHDEEAEQREASRLGALKGSVTRQLTPLSQAVADLGARVDDLAAKLDATPSARATPPARIGPGARSATAEAPAPAARPAPAPAPAPGSRAGTSKWAPKGTAPALPKVAPAPPEPPAKAASPRPPSRAAKAAPVVARRVSTRSAPVADDPGPPTNGAPTRTNGASAPVTRRVATARVTAARAVDATADEVDDSPVPPPKPRVLTRRKAAAPAAEPLVVYELEDETGGDDDDADWAPPAWVSEAANRPGRGTRSRTP